MDIEVDETAKKVAAETAVLLAQNERSHPSPYYAEHSELVQAYQGLSIELITALRQEIAELKDVNRDLVSNMKSLEDEIWRLRKIITPRNYLNGVSEVEEEIAHKTTLRNELRRRLHALELDQARKGRNCPPEVDMEIADIQEKLLEIEAKLKILTYDLDQMRVATPSET